MLPVAGSSQCEVETGEVLAIAGAPHFDPLSRVTADGTPFANFAVRGMYEPGSTQKLITVGAAIEEGVVSPDTVIGAVTDQIELRDRGMQERHRRGFWVLLRLRKPRDP